MSSHKWKTTAVRWLDFSGEVAEKVRADGKVQPVFTILDCEDFMCIKYIAGIGRNQDALNSSAPDNTKMVDIKGIEPLILPFINIQQQRLYAYEGGCSAIELMSICIIS